MELEIKLARNMFGGRLSPRVAARITAYIANPTEEAWDEIKGVLVNPRMTIWQAWTATDDTAPRTGRTTDAKGRVLKKWERWPTAEELDLAMRFATH